MSQKTTEYEFVHDGVTVNCKRRTAKLDRRHLVVMFAGIRPIDSYEFDGRGSRDSQANWLWMKDDFGGQYSYYLCNALDFSVERAVLAAIDAELERLGLSRQECTLAGFSKGGFAALYFGLKYDFPNIIASAPQIYLGSHTRKHRPKIYSHLTDTGSDAEHRLLDSLIPEAVAADGRLDRNIYLFSSASDHFHAEQVEPALPMLRRYTNFNYIETDSDIVVDHPDVTRYHMPLLLSTLYALGENIAPRYGEVRNGSRQDEESAAVVLKSQRHSTSAVVELRSARISEAKFFPEGVAFLRGHSVDKPDVLATSMVLNGHHGSFDFPLVQVQERGLYHTYYQEAFCDYRFGNFRAGKGGIDLAALPCGEYEVKLTLASADAAQTAVCTSSQPTSTEGTDGGAHLIRFRSGPRGGLLQKRQILGSKPLHASFAVEEQWARADTIHFEGTFAVHGVEMSGWFSGRYYLVLSSGSAVHSFPLGTARAVGLPDHFGDGISDYSHARFATPRRKGISMARMEPGFYSAHISLSAAGGLFTEDTGRRIKLESQPDGGIRALILDAPIESSTGRTARWLVRALKRRARRFQRNLRARRNAN